MTEREQISKVQEMVHEMKVGEVMTANLITVHPKTPMRDLRGLLRENKISGLPVVDESGLVGIVSLEDFIRTLAEGTNHCTIEEKMTGGVRTLYADEPLTSAIDKFQRSGLGRFPVVDRETGKLVGILTKGDVIRGLLRKLDINYDQDVFQWHRSSHIFEDIEADSATLRFVYEVMGKDFKRAGEGSSRLKRTLTHLGIRPDIVRRLVIATYEAEMNMVIFTPRGQIAVEVEATRVKVEIEDSGPGIPDIEKALTPGYSTASDWVREMGFGAGMGLPNIRKMSDEFEIESREGVGTRLKLIFYTEEDANEAC